MSSPLAPKITEAAARQINAERTALGWTKDQLADKAGIARRTFHRLINVDGTATTMSLKQFTAIAEALGIPTHLLMVRVEERAQSLPDPIEPPVSEDAPMNVTRLHPRDLTAEQLDELGEVADASTIRKTGDEATDPD